MKKMNKVPERILIVKLSSIGDVVMATPVARALREALPGSYIAWVVERKSADVVLGNPYLDDVIVWDRLKGSSLPRFLRSAADLRRAMRGGKFDVCLDLQGLLRSACVCLLSGVKRRIGFSDGAEFCTCLYTDKLDPGDDPDLNAQQRNLNLLRPLGINSTDTDMLMPIGDDDREFAEAFIKDNGLADEKLVALVPATTQANKHWAPDAWSGLVDLLGERYNARGIVFGSKVDVPLATTIRDAAEHKPVISAGQTTLKQAGALMEKCRVVVAVDTGLLHIAVALDRPSVGLFGASAWRCFIRKDNFIPIARDFPCSPCRRHPTCEDVDCMRAIKPEDVAEAVRRWIE